VFPLSARSGRLMIPAQLAGGTIIFLHLLEGTPIRAASASWLGGSPGRCRMRSPTWTFTGPNLLTRWRGRRNGGCAS